MRLPRTIVRDAPEAPTQTVTRTATLEVDAGALSARLVPWDTAARVSDDGGRTHYLETWAHRSLTPAPVVPVYASHTQAPGGGVQRGDLIGRLDALDNRADGLYADVILANTPEAQRVRELARTVGASVSIEAAVLDGPAEAGSEVVRTDGLLTGVAIILAPQSPAYPDAQVLAVREDPTPEPEPEVEPEVETADDPEVIRADAVAQVGEMVRRELSRAGLRTGGAPSHPLARFDSLDACLTAARADAEVAHQFRDAYRAHALARVWVDQTTDDGGNAGVVPPGWTREVFGIIDRGRPVVSAIGSRPLPDAGMDVNWPYFDGDLTALVGEQADEKTDITSVVVDLKKGTAPLKTYAGGSDVSLQLIRRSEPSYRDAYMRILTAAYAAVTDSAAGTALTAAATTGGTVWDPSSDTDGTAFRKALFASSIEVLEATGQPASVVLMASDVFAGMGGLTYVAPAAYNPNTVTGTADASTLNVSVSGLRVVAAPYLANGTVIVTNGLAAAWFEDGPNALTALDVPKLGENVAVWGMGALGVMLPAGVISVPAA